MLIFSEAQLEYMVNRVVDAPPDETKNKSLGNEREEDYEEWYLVAPFPLVVQPNGKHQRSKETE